MSRVEERIVEACNYVIEDLRADRDCGRRGVRLIVKLGNDPIDSLEEVVNRTIAIRVLENKKITPEILKAIETQERINCGIDPK